MQSKIKFWHIQNVILSTAVLQLGFWIFYTFNSDGDYEYKY